jgi:VCBS repeat protein/PASTA domain-containing protein
MRVVGAALVAAGLLVVPLASAASFGRPAEIPLVRAPTAVSDTDVTQDGNDDVVLGNAAGPPLTVLPGKDDGSFGAPLDIGTGPAPRSLAVADLDNDGATDVAVAGGGEIAIYYGADGTLVRRTVLRVPEVSSVTAADLDLDGNYDIVAASATRSTVTVFAGTDDGTFLAGRDYATANPPAAIYVADLNGDEFPEVAVGGNALTVLLNNRDGTLSSPVPIGGPSEILALTGEDVDADGDVDLVAAHRPNLVTVELNSGEGQFPESGTYAVGATPVGVGVAFLDDDGALDIAAANRGTNDISILSGIGDGRFNEQSRLKVGKGPAGLAIGDLNGDGLNDLVTANRLGTSVTVALQGADAPQPVVCLVPAVARRKLAVARRLVSAANCKVTSVRRRFSGRIKKGKVISITPVPGTRRPVGTAVTLLVSRGHKSTR